MMIDVFSPIGAFLKFKNVSTDNNVFRMHYKLTVVMLLVFALMVTSKQFFGDPIHCINNNEKNVDVEAINSYCWIYGTYTLKSRLVGIEGRHMAYPGIGPENGVNDAQIKHSYYQWVCFVLFGQAVMFYVPRYLWKLWEGGRLSALVSDLANPVVSKDWPELRRGELISYFNYTNSHMHNAYAMRYAMCEILNLVNVVGQIFFLDVFLGGAFRNYGVAVAAFTHIPQVPANMIDYENVNPMDKYFPKLTKCWIRNYGPTGSLQIKDRLCVLPMNIVNEKIFIILWFWMIGLAFISALAVLFRIFVFTFRSLRTVIIVGQIRYVKRNVVSKIVKQFSFGDWFVLYLLGKNMNPVLYKDLVVELSKEFNHKTIMV